MVVIHPSSSYETFLKTLNLTLLSGKIILLIRINNVPMLFS